MTKKMKTFLSLVLVTSMAVVTACGGSSSTPASSTPSTDNTNKVEAQKEEPKIKPMRMRASSGLPETHALTVFYKGLAEQVTKETDGAVKFDIFTSGELLKLGTEFDALRQGTIDLAFTMFATYDPSRFPYTEVTMLPVLETDAIKASKAVQALMRSDRPLKDGKTYYQLEFEDNGLVAFAVPPTDPYVFGTTKHEFKTIADFNQSIRLRSPSRVTDLFSKNVGITAMNLPIQDAYDGLSRNALDGIFLSTPDWKTFGMDELLKHAILGVNLGHFVSHTAMTQKTWDSLPKELQDIFIKAADEQMIVGANEWVKRRNVGVESFESKGGKFTNLEDLAPEVQEHINKAMVQTWFTWIENLESKNLPGKEMAMLWRDSILEAGGKVPQEVMDLK